MKKDIRDTIRENLLKKIEVEEQAHVAQAWVNVLKSFTEILVAERMIKAK